MKFTSTRGGLPLVLAVRAVITIKFALAVLLMRRIMNLTQAGEDTDRMETLGDNVDISTPTILGLK